MAPSAVREALEYTIRWICNSTAQNATGGAVILERLRAALSSLDEPAPPAYDAEAEAAGIRNFEALEAAHRAVEAGEGE